MPPGLFNRGNGGRRLYKEPLGTWPAPAQTPSTGGPQPGWDRCLTPRAGFQSRSAVSLSPCVRGLARRPVSPASCWPSESLLLPSPQLSTPRCLALFCHLEGKRLNEGRVLGLASLRQKHLSQEGGGEGEVWDSGGQAGSEMCGRRNRE